MATILDELRLGFRYELLGVATDEALALMNDGFTQQHWSARKPQICNSLMSTYGNFIVKAAVLGLTDERSTLLLAQEYGRMKAIRLRGQGTEPVFENVVIAAIKTMFDSMMQGVIEGRVQEWAEESGVEGAAVPPVEVEA